MLGCIADDVTGATDLATNLVQGGMSVIQWLDVPTLDELRAHPAQGAIIALKSRSIPQQQAVEQSLQALRVLRETGCQRFLFKYCSTFDSTPRGNIGPVANALRCALENEQAVYCPAFPRNGRTVCRGYLFVGDVLLNESGMELHPLNPMTDASLLRTLQNQVTEPVGLLSYPTIERGQNAILDRLSELQLQGVVHVVVDCLSDRHLEVLAGVFAHFPLITGGSGMARFLPDAYRKLKLIQAEPAMVIASPSTARCAILSGSCSSMTQRQVTMAKPHCACYPIDPAQVMTAAKQELFRFRQWLAGLDFARPALIYSTADPSRVRDVQQRFGGAQIANALEAFQAEVASALVHEAGVGALIVAGGETSGAVVKGLRIRGLRIGQEICAGVPWTRSLGEPALALALKSGNFGNEDFFLTAFDPS